jgi:hypothetical protein
MIPVEIRAEIANPCQNEKKRTALMHKNFGIGLYERIE